MKRKILYKAKVRATGQWVELEPTFNFKNGSIDLNSLSQYIGRKDKTGQKIYEGDYDSEGIFVTWCDNCHGYEFGQIDIPTKDICIPCHRCDNSFFFEDHIDCFQVIGNIFD